MPLGDPTGYSQSIGPLNESTFVDTPDVPLGFRMMEHLPGLSTTIAFGSMRGSNTMMYGGFMDDLGDPQKVLSARRQKRLAKRASKHRIMVGGHMSDAMDSHFMGSSSRQTSARAAGKTPFLRSSRVNNITANPRAFFRGHSQTIFAGEKAGAYSMFGGYKLLNSKHGQRLAGKILGNNPLVEGEKAFGPGLLSGISAGVTTDALERRALKGSSRAAAKLGKIDTATSSLLRINSPAGLTVSGGQFGRIIPKSMGMGIVAPAGQTAAQTAVGLGGYNAATGAGALGVRGNLQASALAGAATGYLAGYSRGALGFGGQPGLVGRAAQGAKAAEDAFAKAVQSFGDDGIKLASGQVLKGADEAVSFLRSTGGEKFFSQVGARTALKLGGKGAAGMMAMRGAALAMPGLQVVAAASLAYDLARLGGELVKSGINFTRDANKSLQGSIAKPTFGMGFRDTEAAATSRARGVQAIQNSRLNARSMLGTEGAMMAAHYG